MRLSNCLLLCCLSLGLTRVQATDRIWPNPTLGDVCAGTLQQCINAAAAGDRIIVSDDEFPVGDGYTLIDEDVVINKSLRLFAGPGVGAVFAPQRGISIFPGFSTSADVAISDLTFQSGYVIVSPHAGDGGRYEILRSRFLGLSNQEDSGCAILLQADGSANNFTFTASYNTFLGNTNPDATESGICFGASSTVASHHIDIFGNRFFARGGQHYSAIAIETSAGGRTRIVNNAVHGNRFRRGIYFTRLDAIFGQQDLQVHNNRVLQQDGTAADDYAISVFAASTNASVLNNSIAYSERGLRVIGFAGQPITARVASNVVAFTPRGGMFIGPDAGISNSHNLVYAIGTGNSWTAGPSTLTAHPRWSDPITLRPGVDSPLINAGSQSDARPNEFAGDLTGEPRVIFGQVDIGAIEYKPDLSGRVVATPLNSGFNEVLVGELATRLGSNLTASDNVFATLVRTSPSANVPAAHLGVYDAGAPPGSWSVFLQNPADTMPLGQAVSVHIPLAAKTSFVHQTSLANTSGSRSQLNSPELNGNFYAIAIAMHRWLGTYHDVPIGVEYRSGFWHVRNERLSDTMPVDARFNIVVAPDQSPNAGRFFNSVFAPASRIWLNFATLQDRPCAAPLVGRMDWSEADDSDRDPQPFSLQYVPGAGPGAPGQWAVQAEGPGNPMFPPSAGFNLILDGHQLDDCESRWSLSLLRDGFE